MYANMSNIERLFLINVGANILIAGLGKRQRWGLLGLIPLLTGLTGFCCVYCLLGKTTRNPDAPWLPRLASTTVTRG